MTELLNAEYEDEKGEQRRLTRDEVLDYVNLLAAAGNETTTRLIGWTAKVLADHPEQRRELAENRELVPQAIEELLRYESPSPVQARFVVRDVEHRGRVVPREASSSCSTGRRTGTSGSSPRATGSTSTAGSTSTWPSGTACISAWVPRWPGSRVGSPSTRSCSASPRGRSIGTTPSRPGRQRYAAGSGCRSSYPTPMLLEVNADQRFFQETSTRFLEERAPASELRRLRDDPIGFDPAYWRDGVHLGWTSLLVGEENGGGKLSDHGLSDLALLAFELVVTPLPGPCSPPTWWRRRWTQPRRRRRGRPGRPAVGRVGDHVVPRPASRRPLVG